MGFEKIKWVISRTIKIIVSDFRRCYLNEPLLCNDYFFYSISYKTFGLLLNIIRFKLIEQLDRDSILKNIVNHKKMHL